MQAIGYLDRGCTKVAQYSQPATQNMKDYNNTSVEVLIEEDSPPRRLRGLSTPLRPRTLSSQIGFRKPYEKYRLKY
ncbi:hypothetical protein MBAV_002566 [Candidatus Magnetobacterium bavaricum]|uniref:Uncharacterized protein n=1 Tax=Candidatus Magnetobacterium bavaricum TaxID=29290 RepID=A0A0F3GTG7_9BACT|nr:hypothetical protein MBAV_002566 [Candidatus Magnetobacterium bavaricum]